MPGTKKRLTSASAPSSLPIPSGHVIPQGLPFCKTGMGGKTPSKQTILRRGWSSKGQQKLRAISHVFSPFPPPASPKAEHVTCMLLRKRKASPEWAGHLPSATQQGQGSVGMGSRGSGSNVFGDSLYRVLTSYPMPQAQPFRTCFPGQGRRRHGTQKRQSKALGPLHQRVGRTLWVCSLALTGSWNM